MKVYAGCGSLTVKDICQALTFTAFYVNSQTTHLYNNRKPSPILFVNTDICSGQRNSSTKCDFAEVTKEWLTILLHIQEGSGSIYRVKVLTNAHDVFRGVCSYRTWTYSRAL